MRKLKINVTQRDIDLGVVGEPTACPISRAVRRALGRRQLRAFAWDGILTKSCCVQIGERVKHLPLEAQQFIKRFDSNKPVHPLTFKINPLTVDAI